MPNDNDTFWARAVTAEADGAFDGLAWWVTTGGLTLLVWTGLALILTSA